MIAEWVIIGQDALARWCAWCARALSQWEFGYLSSTHQADCYYTLLPPQSLYIKCWIHQSACFIIVKAKLRFFKSAFYLRATWDGYCYNVRKGLLYGEKGMDDCIQWMNSNGEGCFVSKTWHFGILTFSSEGTTRMMLGPRVVRQSIVWLHTWACACHHPHQYVRAIHSSWQASRAVTVYLQLDRIQLHSK